MAPGPNSCARIERIQVSSISLGSIGVGREAASARFVAKGECRRAFLCFSFPLAQK